MAARSRKAATAPRPPARPTRRQVEVDDYTGLTAAAAIEAARASGLRPAPERIEIPDAERQGVVVAHDPQARVSTAKGTILTLYVGAPPADPPPAAADPVRAD